MSLPRTPRLLAVVVAVTALTACADDGPAVAPRPAVSDGEPVSAPIAPADGVVLAGTPMGDVEGFSPIGDVEVRLVPAGRTETAVDLAVRPGDDALYVAEHDGRVVRVDAGGNRVVADVTERLVGHLDEQGLTGLEFAADGAFAWLHATDAAGRTTVSEVAVLPDGTFDLATERQVLDLSDPPGENHNAGDLLLAPDGTLLVTIGDGSNGGIAEDGTRFVDPNRVGHDPTALRGSILRIRPTPGGDRAYEIPDDNPFATGSFDGADGPVAGAPEVLAWGMRNPWKIDLDPGTDTLWVGDVGARTFEEINVVRGDGGRFPGWGTDFGWSRFEGVEPRNADLPAAGGTTVDPVLVYAHDSSRCAVSGGVVYRGDAIPELQSAYVFADFCEGSVWAFDATDGRAEQLAIGVPGISGVRRGPDGELYVLSWFGEILRIEPA